MNEFDAFAMPRRGGWWAMLRLAKDGEPKSLKGEGGKPILYADELTATKAALAHLLAYFNGNLVCSGEIAGATIKISRRAAADRIFKKGRMIEVTRKGGGIRE